MLFVFLEHNNLQLECGLRRLRRQLSTVSQREDILQFTLLSTNDYNKEATFSFVRVTIFHHIVVNVFWPFSCLHLVIFSYKTVYYITFLEILTNTCNPNEYFCNHNKLGFSCTFTIPIFRKIGLNAPNTNLLI